VRSEWVQELKLKAAADNEKEQKFTSKLHISNPGVGEIFRTCPDRPWGPLSLLYNGYRVFPGVKSGRDVTLTP
jgi:hypothetical protein